MEHQAFELLLKRFDDVDRRFDDGHERMEKIELRLDELWKFRWFLAGAASIAGTIAGALVTFGFNFIVSVLSK